MTEMMLNDPDEPYHLRMMNDLNKIYDRGDLKESVGFKNLNEGDNLGY